MDFSATVSTRTCSQMRHRQVLLYMWSFVLGRSLSWSTVLGLQSYICIFDFYSPK